MNIEQLCKEISTFAHEPEAHDLIALLQAWKSNDSTVLELSTMVERYIGNVWFRDEQTHQRIFEVWSAFRREAIDGISGMTMNERLYCFDLFESFDSASTKQRVKINEKLCASP